MCSNRFAAHVLSYQQLYALFKERGWVANYLGPYDDGGEGRARREFPDAGLTTVFEHFQIDGEAGAFRGRPVQHRPGLVLPHRRSREDSRPARRDSAAGIQQDDARRRPVRWRHLDRTRPALG